MIETEHWQQKSAIGFIWRIKMLNKELEEAIFSVFDLEINAAKNQKERGGSDQGRRAGVTAGKHLDPLADYLAKELINAGIKPRDIFTGSSNMEIPGWFRPNKQWDLLAFDNKALVTAIELKSIGSSYGNNFNNRTEEALGSATDASAAVKYNMFKNEQPPAFGYVMVVRSDESSRKTIDRIPEPHFKVDPIFYYNSYLDRFKIMCTRMLAEKLYDAIWLVFVNTETREIKEPVKALSYDNFMKKMKLQIELFKN